jgi:methylmalonyl-CoA mutase
VFLAKMGPPSQHKARADFSAGFFAVGGFEIVAKEAFATAGLAAEAAVKANAQVAVLCSTDDTYPTLVPVFASSLRKNSPHVMIVVAGLPADPELAAVFRRAGVDEFIHLRANVHEVLAGFLNKIGVNS